MFDILWTNFGLLIQPRQTLEKLEEYSTKHLFLYGLMLSIAAMSSLFLGEMLKQGVAPHTLFFQLLAYYIGSFFFISIALVGIIFYKRQINIPKFLGLYLSTELPLLMMLPISMIALAYPIFSSFLSVVSLVLGILVWIYKILSFVVYFKISSSQAFLIFIMPTVLLLFWIITSIITLFNYSIVLF